MRRWLVWISFLICQTSYAVSVVDDVGQTVHLNKPAQRIVSFAPDITEILFAVGADQQVVGVISGSDYPAAARQLPVIGSYLGVDLERILALHPDLVICWHGTFARQIAVLKKMGIPVYETQPRKLLDVAHSMRRIGRLAGTAAAADQAAKQFTERFGALQMRYQSALPVKVFFQIGDYSLLTINQDSWINQAITLCGGRNVFANLHSIAPAVSWEAAVIANPDVIISDAAHDAWRAGWQKRTSVTAVKRGALFRLDPDLIERAGPRLLAGTEQLCRYLDVARAAA